jgi:hypothetical protein
MNKKIMKKMIIYIIVGVVVVLALAGGYFWYNMHMSSTAKVLEYRDFSCGGVTFKYPVFEGWPASEVKGDCFLPFGTQGDPNIPLEIDAGPVLAPGVFVETVEKNNQVVKEGDVGVQKNPSNILYTFLTQTPLAPNAELNYLKPGEPYGVFFYGPYFNVEISITKPLSLAGFPQDLFFKTVIESFKLIK